MEPQFIMLPVDQVKIGTRQRTVDEATKKHIEDLARDIGSDGLIHAIAVSQDHDLIAGFCRLNAVKSLDKPFMYASTEVAPGFIPCVMLHHTSQQDQFRVELMENLRRKNLSPMDEALAVATLHEFFVETKGPAWTQGETGVELDRLRGDERTPNVSQAEVADSIILKRFQNDPDVAAAPSRRKAVAVAKKKMEQTMTAALGAVMVLDRKDFTLIEEDCRAAMRKMAPETLDGIIVDPPYGVDADKFGDQAMAGGHDYSDTEELAVSIANAVFTRGFDLCKPNAHLYLFCDLAYFDQFAEIAELAGWSVFPKPLIWHKPNVGHCPIPGLWALRYETILFAYKGNRLLSSVRSNVFEYPVPANRLHAAGKPVELYEEFMKYSFLPGEVVFDPCAGGGTIFRAAKRQRLRAIGCEVNAQSANLCRAAIAES